MDDPFATLADLHRLCALETLEGLGLEGKRKADPTLPLASKEDKRHAVEAIAAFANADGGTLIFGIG